MKRSDMVDLIHELFWQMHYDENFCASDALSEIEKAGMLPPISNVSTIVLPDGSIVFPGREWDPE